MKMIIHTEYNHAEDSERTFEIPLGDRKYSQEELDHIFENMLFDRIGFGYKQKQKDKLVKVWADNGTETGKVKEYFPIFDIEEDELEEYALDWLYNEYSIWFEIID